MTKGDLGAILRARRTTCGLTQVALARQLGIRPETVCRWERGKNRPRPRRQRSLAQVLATSVTSPLVFARKRLPPERAATIAMVLDQVSMELRGA